ncbi:ankyrin repeat-containing domain protein [Tuber indicum]|nr:ankyrin repeat-containing domain protein [Tuber indicum]
MSLLDLPNELLLQIANDFTHVDLAHLLLVNRRTAYLYQHLLDRLALDPKDNLTALNWACSRGHLPLARLLINYGFDVNERCQTLGRTPLHFAVLANSEEIVEILLAAGADPNVKNNAGSAPLHWSALCGSYEMSALLLAKGAGAETKNSAWMTPLHCALENAVEALAQLVAEQGIEPSLDVDTTTVPFPNEEYLRRRKVVKLVLENKPWLDAQDKAGLTALHYAAKGGRTRVVKWLLERGADAYVRDGNRCTALDIAKFIGHTRVAGILRDHYEKEREPLWSVFVGNVLGVIGIGR